LFFEDFANGFFFPFFFLLFDFLLSAFVEGHRRPHNAT
jgi:hypothetical protein